MFHQLRASRVTGVDQGSLIPGRMPQSVLSKPAAYVTKGFINQEKRGRTHVVVDLGAQLSANLVQSASI